MAIISTHTLNGVDGSHAGGVGVVLVGMQNDGTRKQIFEAETDTGGRLAQEVDPALIEPTRVYELTFLTGKYWSAQAYPANGQQIAKEIAIRLTMPDADARYHVPLILSPHSCSVWVSAAEKTS